MQKNKIRKKFTKTKYTTQSNSHIPQQDADEELLPKAFDANEVFDIPDDYIIDEELNLMSIQFLKNVEKERRQCENKHKKMHEEIHVGWSKDVNNHLQFTEIYKKMDISQEFIQYVKNEYWNTKSALLPFKQAKEDGGGKFTNASDFILYLKFTKNTISSIPEPNDQLLALVSPLISNQICIKLISTLRRLLPHSICNCISYFHICLWMYYFLIFLEMPLIDEDNSVLYSLNQKMIKLIFEKSEDKSISTPLKIVYILISEIFKQKVISFGKDYIK